MRNALIGLVLLAGLGAVAQNVVVYSDLVFGSAPVGREGDDPEDQDAEYDEDSDGVEIEAEIGAVSDDFLAEYLGGLPAIDRNPFARGRPEVTSAAPVDVGPAPPVRPTFPLLDGTLVNRNRRIAWFANRPFTEGQLVDGYEIAIVEVDHVVLRKENQRHVVRIADDAATQSDLDKSDLADSTSE